MATEAQRYTKCSICGTWQNLFLALSLALLIREQNLFLHGARENSFPPEYIDYLESFPRYAKLDGPDRTYGQLVFDLGWRPFLKRLVRLTTWRVDEDGNCPAFIALIIVWAYRIMWLYHDYIHRHILGRGDGGKLHWEDVGK